MAAAEAFAKKLRQVWDLGQGDAVEDALYTFGTSAPSPDTTIQAKGWQEVLAEFHKAEIDDQFVPPLVRVDGEGNAVGLVKENDILFYTDFRTDRAKPLTSAFMNVSYDGQDGGLSEAAAAKRPEITMVTMTHYDDKFTESPRLKEAFNPAKPLEDTYAEVIGREGIDQLIVAESEKWRAVTWFKDGRRNLGYEEHSDDGSLRVDKHPSLPITVKITRSRKVAAHIQAPEMRAKELTETLLQGVSEGVSDIFANYANADMVAHAMTSNSRFEGVVQAITELDNQLGRLVPEAVAAGYVVIITGDHGNAEEMAYANGQANPSHTTNKVPFIILGLDEDESGDLDPDATIGDMAPLMLHLRGIKAPSSWDRTSPLSGTIKPRKDRKIMRLILDGYGVREAEDANAMAQAAKQKGSPLNMDRWIAGEDRSVYIPAEASGVRCGYPEGESGTTEFGHVLFDAGRTVRSDLTLIDHAIEAKEFDTNPAFVEAMDEAKKTGATLHITGILSDGKVHASLNHMSALLSLLASHGFKGDQVSLHPITDGRDVAGDSSPQYITWLEEKINELGVGQINSLWGRGWGKDRDNRWKRIEAAFRSFTEGTAGVHVQFIE